MSEWKPLDTKKAIEQQRRQHEGTTSAGAGGYAVPLGQPLRPPAPVPPYKTVKKSKKSKK